MKVYQYNQNVDLGVLSSTVLSIIYCIMQIVQFLFGGLPFEFAGK